MPAHSARFWAVVGGASGLGADAGAVAPSAIALRRCGGDPLVIAWWVVACGVVVLRGLEGDATEERGERDRSEVGLGDVGIGVPGRLWTERLGLLARQPIAGLGLSRRAGKVGGEWVSLGMVYAGAELAWLQSWFVQGRAMGAVWMVGSRPCI